MNETIFDAKWEELLPESLKADKRIYAMALAIAEQKRKLAKGILIVNFWADPMCLPDDLLDVMAYDLHVENYSASAGREEKIRMISGAAKIHMKKGTMEAVSESIKTKIGKDAEIEEWFQYDGTPHCFRVTLGEYQEPRTILSTINQSKRLSAWLDALRMREKTALSVYAAGMIRCAEKINLSAEENNQEQIAEMKNSLVDEGENTLINENGEVLFYEEE